MSKYARYGKDGPVITLREFLDREGKTDPNIVGQNGHIGWSVDPLCCDCHTRVHIYDVLGALGFKSVQKDVTKRHRVPGFHHYDHNPDRACPSYFAGDPDFAEIYSHNKFNPVERARNKAVCFQDNMRLAHKKILTSLMLELTGKEDISDEIARALERILDTRILSMAGIADNPWLVPFVQVALIGPQVRTSQSGRSYMAVFETIGHQTLDYTVEGKKEKMWAPGSLRLCFASKTGRKQQPMRRYKNGPAVVVDISRKRAADMIISMRRKFHGSSLHAERSAFRTDPEP